MGASLESGGRVLRKAISKKRTRKGEDINGRDCIRLTDLSPPEGEGGKDFAVISGEKKQMVKQKIPFDSPNLFPDWRGGKPPS